jgi:hypothetical protein
LSSIQLFPRQGIDAVQLKGVPGISSFFGKTKVDPPVSGLLSSSTDSEWKPKYVTRTVTEVGSKNVSVLFPIRVGSFLIMRTTERMYIGEVMDIFKKGGNGRYGSIDLAASASEIHAFSLRVYLPLQTTVGVNG